MTTQKRVESEVLSAGRSPMNPKRYLLQLSCGHEKWITATKRPARKKATCTACSIIATRKEAPDAP